jgi:hypothetical protein
MKNNFTAGMMLALMTLGTGSAAHADTVLTLAPNPHEDAATLPAPVAMPLPSTSVDTALCGHRPVCTAPGLIRSVAGGDPLANLRDAHKDPQRCKLSICIPASINLDVVCELTTARDSEARYNCRMVINDFLRNCTESCHTGDWSWLDSYRGPY